MPNLCYAYAMQRGRTKNIVSLVTSLAIAGLLALAGAVFAPSTPPHDATHENTSLKIFVEPQAGTAPVIGSIEHASSTVDLVMYELEDKDVEMALAHDAARGVVVRVLLNEGYYGRKENTFNDEAYQYLSENGVHVKWTPSYFALTHQKTLIVDNATATIMTFNLTPQYYSTSRDFGIVDSDANDVAAIEDTFASDWNDSQKTAQNGDDLLWSPGAKLSTVDLIDNARTSLDVYNEEMADTYVTNALAAAAKRGVLVRIVMTDDPSWHKASTALKDAGASIEAFRKSAPLYIHAKVIVADGSRAFVGSQNFSENSLLKNRELGVITDSTSTVAVLKDTFENDWVAATPF